MSEVNEKKIKSKKNMKTKPNIENSNGYSNSLHLVPILFIIGATIILITFYVGTNVTFRNKAHNVGKMRLYMFICI